MMSQGENIVFGMVQPASQITWSVGKEHDGQGMKTAMQDVMLHFVENLLFVQQLMKLHYVL
jgi:hypothetical protein